MTAGASLTSILLQGYGWVVFLRVDGQNFGLLGHAGEGGHPELVGTTVTPTRTVIRTRVKGVEANVTYFSPIEVRSILFMHRKNGC